MNIQSVVGSYLKKDKLLMIGTLDSELELKNLSLIMFWEIEHSIIVLVKRIKWHGVQHILTKICMGKGN